MFASITSIAIKFVNIGIRMLYIGLVIYAFIMLFNLFQTGVAYAYNYSVLYEIQALIQIWLPFDLGAMFNWIFTATSLIMMYFMYNYGMRVISDLIKD